MDDGSFRLKMVHTVPPKTEVGGSTFRAESGRTVRHPPVWLIVNIVSFLNDESNVSNDRSCLPSLTEFLSGRRIILMDSVLARVAHLPSDLSWPSLSVKGRAWRACGLLQEGTWTGWIFLFRPDRV
jgi:hypothetical protein